MEEQRREDLASARAEEYAPRPTGGLVMAGMVGAGLLLAIDAVVSGFYGWRLRDHPIVLAGLILVGFAAGMVVYLQLKRINRRAKRHERALINAEEDGPAA